MYHAIAHHDGYCAGCSDERPLVVTECGPRGVSAWLAGVGPEDRALSYSCLVCGRVEHVPPTEAEDAEYEATLPTWPDWTPVVQPVAAIAVMPEPVAAVIEAPPARRPVVRIVTMPVQRVGATDDNLLALHVA